MPLPPPTGVIIACLYGHPLILNGVVLDMSIDINFVPGVGCLLLLQYDMEGSFVP